MRNSRREPSYPTPARRLRAGCAPKGLLWLSSADNTSSRAASLRSISRTRSRDSSAASMASMHCQYVVSSAAALAMPTRAMPTSPSSPPRQSSVSRASSSRVSWAARRSPRSSSGGSRAPQPRPASSVSPSASPRSSGGPETASLLPIAWARACACHTSAINSRVSAPLARARLLVRMSRTASIRRPRPSTHSLVRSLTLLSTTQSEGRWCEKPEEARNLWTTIRIR